MAVNLDLAKNGLFADASKLSDSEGEAAETLVWLEFSFHCQYIEGDKFTELNAVYEQIIGKLVNMALRPEKWQY